MLVQRPAVQLPGQLGAEERLVPVLHRVRGQLLAVEARLDHQTEAGALGEVATWLKEKSSLLQRGCRQRREFLGGSSFPFNE